LTQDSTWECADEVYGVKFDKCAGTNMTGSIPCEDGLHCVVKNFFYAQCITKDRAGTNIADNGWDGRQLTNCEDIPEDASKGPLAPDSVFKKDTMPMRRLAQVCISFRYTANVGFVSR
jgi:hypothetical protein